MDDGRVRANGESAVLTAELRALVERVAATDAGVLFRGERGVGKETLAREIHRRSARGGGPFVGVRCAALPEGLSDIESELFGRDRSSPGAPAETHSGAFEDASGGSLFLDEIADLPVAAQAKLLQVLQDHQVTHVGSTTPVPVDVRLFAATDRNVDRLLVTGALRPDVYYRLQVIEIAVRPLRQRSDEIVPLAEHFLARDAAAYQRPPVRLDAGDREALVRYQWPGNIRELENLMRRLVLLQDHSVLSELAGRARPADGADVGPGVIPAIDRRHETPERGEDLQSLARDAALRAEREAIDRALARFHWNRRKAAEFLNVSYKTLLNKMKECGINEVVPAEPASSRHARG